MTKIIKKQIKKSLPLFLIFCLLLSSTALGLVFNVGFQIEKVDNKLKFSFNLPNAKAQNDTALTSVEVRNAPPAIVTGQEPFEFPASTSTSPVNVGASFSFKTTATDAESNDYFLIVCSSAGVTAHNSAPPTCNVPADNLCVSASTTPGNESTCTDASMIDYPTEEMDWYAYVCDGHATQADCSVVSQGNGADADASPLFVNHSPELDAVSTTINNQAPGGTFQFTATSTDTDVEGSADYVVLHICRTNSYSVTTGCDAGQYLCSSTSSPAVASQAVVSCSWTDTAPTPDQAYNYFGFIKDMHTLAALGADGQGTTNSYTIINVTPSISNIEINGGGNITLNMKGVAEVNVVITAQISDNNTTLGGELVQASSTLYWSSVANTLECTANDSNCYVMAPADCTIDNMIGASADLTCTTTMAYYAVPTDNANGNDNFGTNWLAGMKVVDDDDAYYATTTVNSDGVEVLQTLALNISEANIPYQVVKGGQNTEDYNATTTVVNYGNTPLDTNIDGTDMTHEIELDKVIHDFNQRFDLIARNYDLLGTQLSSTTPALIDVNIARPITADNVTDEIYWGIGIPNGTISGNYAGVNTFTGQTDNDGNWN